MKHIITLITILSLLSPQIFGIFLESKPPKENVLGINTDSLIDYKKIATDHQPPTLKFTDKIFDSKSTHEFSIISNEEIKFLNLPENIKFQNQSLEIEKSYFYTFKIETGLDKAKIQEIKAFDMVGNMATEKIFLNMDLFEYESKTNEDCYSGEFNLLIGVDKNTCIEESLLKEIEIIDIPKKIIKQEESSEIEDQTPIEKQIQINVEVYDPLIELIDAAYTDNITILVNSGFRTIEDQKEIQENYSKLFNIEKQPELTYLVDEIVAKPGYSEHHLGTTVDFASNEINPKTGEDKPFGDTEAYQWLLENAWKYGFVESYPKRKENITGYRHEPWHWRYIGEEDAENLYLLKDLSLEEYVWLLGKN